MWNSQAQGLGCSQWSSSPPPLVIKSRASRDGCQSAAGFARAVRRARLSPDAPEPIRKSCRVEMLVTTSKQTAGVAPTRHENGRRIGHRTAITMPMASTNSRLKTGRNPLTLLTLVILRPQLRDRSSGSECGTHKQLSGF